MGSDAKAALHDWRLPASERAAAAVQDLSLEEKVSQTIYDAPAIERLGIRRYNWWNECLHGVGRAGVATVFPQSIGLAATFDPALVGRVATAISTEARAKHHEFSRRGDRDIYKGLTFWTPNINIFRDPRWGRGQETYGEDPYLTGRMGVAFVRGLQGEDARYLKVVATPKHFAVHSGPEGLRHTFDVGVSRKDLYETYLPAFRECVMEAGAFSVMGAYNRVNGEPCCASTTLLGEILRGEWGFRGYVVSDCGAIDDIHARHTWVSSAAKAAAAAVRAGCDLNCGRTYQALVEAVRGGLLPEEVLDTSVRRLMEARIRLGEFDPPERVPYAAIPYSANDCAEHRALALEAARASIVLLKNQGELLPLGRDTPCIAVIGPNADDRPMLLGNYSGTPSSALTLLAGIRQAVAPGSRVLYARGCDWSVGRRGEWSVSPCHGFAEALSAAEQADVVVLCLGLTASLEGEEGDAAGAEWAGDRISIGLPAVQEELLRGIVATGKPTVLVLSSGSPVAIPWADAKLPAILQSWYPGEEGGTAVAEVLFGAVSPSGRLPVTFVESLDQLPPFTDYRMRNRTYRYLESRPLYPFGYGLSFTSFLYRGLTLSSSAADTAGLPADFAASVEVENSGRVVGEEVVQLYLRNDNARSTVPRWRLAGVRRVRLEPGRREQVSFAITEKTLAYVDDEGRSMLAAGKVTIWIGGRQPDERSEELMQRAGRRETITSGALTIRGPAREIQP